MKTGIKVLVMVALVAASPLLAEEDARRPVPELETLEIAAKAIYNIGNDNNEIASVIKNFSDLDTSALAVREVKLGTNGSILNKLLAKCVFHREGAYAQHLSLEDQKKAVRAFHLTMWTMSLNKMRYYEVTGIKPLALIGDGEIITSPSALAIRQGGRVLLLRAYSFD